MNNQTTIKNQETPRRGSLCLSGNASSQPVGEFFNKGVRMKYYKLKYSNSSFKIVKGKNSLEIIKKYDLASRANINTRIIELSGEQEAKELTNG